MPYHLKPNVERRQCTTHQLPSHGRTEELPGKWYVRTQSILLVVSETHVQSGSDNLQYRGRIRQAWFNVRFMDEEPLIPSNHHLEGGGTTE